LLAVLEDPDPNGVLHNKVMSGLTLKQSMDHRALDFLAACGERCSFTVVRKVCANACVCIGVAIEVSRVSSSTTVLPCVASSSI